MAYSSIEDKYLSALTAVQFPDAPVEPAMPEQTMPGRQEGDIMLAAAGAGRGSYEGFSPRQAYINAGPKDEMKAFEPTIKQSLADYLQMSFEKLGMDRYKARKNAQTLIGGPSSNLPLDTGLADFVPFLGTTMQLEESGIMAGQAYDSAKRGEYGTAAMQAGGAALGLVPGAASTIKAAKPLVPKAAEMIIEGAERLGTPVRGLNIVESGPNVVSTRLPTAVKATEDPLANNLVIDLQAAKTDPEAFNHNVGLIKQYPNFASKARNPEKQAEDFINEVTSNLLYLYDKVPEQTRVRSKLWYDGARNITSKWADEYQVPDQAVSGVLAVLSPQKDWFMNVSLGQRVLDITSKQQAFKWDAGMDETAKIIWAKPQYAQMVKDIRGKSLSEITDPGLKAMWLRTYDQAYLPREHQIVTPEGEFSGIRLNADNKTPTKTGWGSLNEIGKAIVILEDPSKVNISNNLGTMHKVRNFYNNIYAPNDPSGAVTIDTHAVAAGLLRPLSGNSREVAHNFGSNVKGEVGPANSSITGVQGTYGLYAEAYRRAAQERGVLPREMQSITWEAVRGLFPDTFKNAANADKIDGIWLQYRKGKISQDEARNEVFNTAGGINAPEWERAGLRSEPAQAVPAPIDSGQLSGSGIPGGTAGGVGSGERSGASTGNSSSIKRGRQARTSGAN
jgi:hypothetical protein